MITNLVIVAKSVIKTRQRLSALEYAIKVCNPEMYAVYQEQLEYLEKDNEADMLAFDELVKNLQLPSAI